MSFSTKARVVLPVHEVSAASRGRLRAAVTNLTHEASTNLADGFLKGCRALRAAALPPNRRARLILLTDGLANVGVATSRAELRALVRKHVGPFSLSAFGFGRDCDHSMLAELSEEGGGSFAFIENEDGVLTAFARELGGLVSTYAADVRVRIVPVAGAPIELRLGDVLHQAEIPLCVAIAIPQHAAATNVEVARVHVTFREIAGEEREVTTPVLVDYVPRGDEDATIDPEVLRARDERLLREAQTAAEAHAQEGDYAAAHQALAAAIALMQTPDLVAFARATLLPCYEDQRVYEAATALRASADMALKKRRLLAADAHVPLAMAPPASPAEVAMEASFREDE